MKRILPWMLAIMMLSAAFSAKAQYRRHHPNKDQVEKRKERDSSDKKSFWDKYTIGGNGSATFGQLAYGSVTYIELMPVIGYKVTEKLQVGIGPCYVFRNYMNSIATSDGLFGPYVNYSSTGVPKGVNNSAYGGRIYIHYNFYENFFLRGELEEINTKYAKVVDINSVPEQLIGFSRRFVPATLIGAGVQQRIGERSFANFMILYDLTYDQVYSYNISPVRIVVGFMF